MRFITNILRIIWKVYFFLFFIISMLLMYPFFYWSLVKKSRFKYTFVLFKVWGFLLRLFGGVIMKIEKEAEIPKDTPFVICPNHSSYLDIILMYHVFPDYFVFMGKKEIENWPLFHIFFTKGMNILVDRKSKIGAVRALIRASKEIDEGHSVVVFPEGTIPHTAPRMIRFKNGAFKLAIEKQIPIVPVTYATNWKLLQGSDPRKGKAGPGISKVIVHKRIETKGMTEKDLITLRQQVYDILYKTLEEHGAKQQVD